MPLLKRRYRLQDSEGKRLEKCVLLKLVQPGGRMVQKRHIAPPGKGFSETNIDEMIHNFAEFLDKAFPMHEFRMVEISRTQFNFVCSGERVHCPAAETALGQDAGIS